MDILSCLSSVMTSEISSEASSRESHSLGAIVQRKSKLNIQTPLKKEQNLKWIENQILIFERARAGERPEIR